LDVLRRNFSAHTGIVVNIRAFDADSTVFLAKALKDNMVFGFEPNPVLYEQGKKNAKPFSNIKLYNLGVSNQIGEVDLHVTKNLVSSSLCDIKDESESVAENVIKVKVDTLDNFFSSTGEIKKS
jgi:FkbM family methyltransferase